MTKPATRKYANFDVRLRISEQDEVLFQPLKDHEGAQQRCDFIRRVAVIGYIRHLELQNAIALSQGLQQYMTGVPQSIMRPAVSSLPVEEVPMAEKEIPSEFDEDDISMLFSGKVLSPD